MDNVTDDVSGTRKKHMKRRIVQGKARGIA